MGFDDNGLVWETIYRIKWCPDKGCWEAWFIQGMVTEQCRWLIYKDVEGKYWFKFGHIQII